MPSPTQNNAQQYYIGIAGNQIGPLTQEEVLLRVKNGTVSSETLIWCEGMKEWSLISALSVFDSAFKPLNKPAGEIKQEPLIVSEEKSQPNQTQIAAESDQFMGDESSISVVYDEINSPLTDQSFVTDRLVKIGLGIVALMVLVGGYFFSQKFTIEKQLAKSVKNARKQADDNRQLLLRKATSELLIDPKGSEQILLGLAHSNSIDPISNDAAKTLLDFYLKNQRPLDAGRVLIMGKKYSEAALQFSQDPAGKADAENSYFLAYENAKEPVKRKNFLEENIRLLLSSSNQPKAIKHIHLLEKEFPGQGHPYGYYLKPVDERISQMFSKLSFDFVQSLLNYTKKELPQITLLDRPLVEVLKGGDGFYRIVGSYKGEILLNQDRIPKTHFVFWLNGERWILVDTNLTRERKKWAAEERRRAKKFGVSGEEMLNNLERTLKTKFPESAPHLKGLIQKVPNAKAGAEF